MGLLILPCSSSAFRISLGPRRPHILLLCHDRGWTLPQLITCRFFRTCCKIIVVSRLKFHLSVFDSSYELEFLRDDKSMGQFFHFTFGQSSIQFIENCLRRLWMGVKGCHWLLR